MRKLANSCIHCYSEDSVGNTAGRKCSDSYTGQISHAVLSLHMLEKQNFFLALVFFKITVLSNA